MTGEQKNYIIEVSGDPIAWQRARRNKNVYYDPQFIAKKNFAWVVKSQYFDKPLTKPLKISFTFNFKMPASWSKKKKLTMIDKPHAQTPDTSNLVKFVEDALNQVVWQDDALISKLIAEKKWEEEAKTIIKIEEDL